MIRNIILPAAASCLVLSVPVFAQDKNAQGRAILDEIMRELAVLEGEVLQAEQRPPAPGSQREAQMQIAGLNNRIRTLEGEIASASQVTQNTFSQIAQIVGQVALAQSVAPQAESQDTTGTQQAVLADPVVPETDAIQPQGDGSQTDDTSQTGGTRQVDVVPPNAEDTPAVIVQEPEPAAVPEVNPFAQSFEMPLQHKGLPQRVLALPNGELVKDPSDPDTKRASIPVFSIMYVFGEAEYRGERWLAVGESQSKPNGWIQDFKTEAWRSNLVMRYAPKSERGRVLFFKEPDEVREIVEDNFFGRREVKEIYSQIKQGEHDPNRIIAIEPRGAVDDVENTYLMPILNFEAAEFEDGTPTQILQLAGLNLNSDKRSDTLRAIPNAEGEEQDQEALKDFRVGLAFVIDTTTSMGPYIAEAQNFVSQVETGLQAEGISDRFDFALLGYRDNLQPNERIEYLTEIFRDFGEAESRSAAEDARRMEPSTVSTQNWREDAFAGITDAINRLSWGKVDARLVFLITDAGPRTTGDDLARDAAMGPATIAQMADAADVTLYVMHMLTDRAKQLSLSSDGVDDTSVGRRIYQQLETIGGQRVSYFPLFGDSARNFRDNLQRTADQIIPALVNAANGKGIQIESVETTDADLAAQIDPNAGLFDDFMTVQEIRGEEDKDVIATAVLAEIFARQQEYLGARNGTEAPEFYRAWASDRDLSKPSLETLEVSVMMSRGQISDLTTRLEDLLEAMQDKERGLGDFFAEVQDQSGRAVIDPNIANVLPEYLNDLPYFSPLLSMTEDQWDGIPPDGKEEFVDQVRAKVRGYREIAESQRNWYRLSDREEGEELYPLPLRMLP